MTDHARSTSCLDQETVVALFEGRLSKETAARLDDHMDHCAACRGLVAELAQSSGFEVPPTAIRVTEPPIGHATDEAFLPGRRLADRFQIIRLIGRGAMGVVYEAEDLELGVRLAVKVLPREAAGKTRLIERLRKEIVLGRRITHRHVCRLYDLGTDEGVPFITMELVEGETLAALLARGVPPTDEVVRILFEVLEALEAAHAHGVVHRDLKPSNIMIGPGGAVSVMDFGLARDLNADLSERGVLIGTPAYWSPEQARGERATTASDIYTFGAVACELLGGGRPSWDAEPSLSGVPADYRDVICRCLRLSAEQRFGSAREVREALRAAHRAASGERPKPRRRVVATVFFVLGAGLAGTAVWLASRPDGPRVPVEGRGGATATSRPAQPVPLRRNVPDDRAGGAASATRQVSVRAFPPTATIYRGDELLGRGVVDLAIAPNQPVLVRAESPGYVSQELRVGADRPSWLLTLEPLVRRSREPVRPPRPAEGAEAPPPAPSPQLPFFE
jgi:serine/threonine-protein kinase